MLALVSRQSTSVADDPSSLQPQNVPAWSPPERLPENTQPRNVVAYVPPWPIKPPQYVSIAVILAATSQFSMTFGPPTMEPTRPEQCRKPVTVPATVRFKIVAPSMDVNGAKACDVPLRLTVSVWLPPSKAPMKGWADVPTDVETGPTLAASRTVLPWQVSTPAFTHAARAFQSLVVEMT